jgi:hypothetical protein
MRLYGGRCHLVSGTRSPRERGNGRRFAAPIAAAARAADAIELPG